YYTNSGQIRPPQLDVNGTVMFSSDAAFRLYSPWWLVHEHCVGSLFKIHADAFQHTLGLNFAVPK
ncbi:hypothetical protein, partial [Nitrosomonas supralitoralis]|uniref:hypothetical protein n=1 Tax=Nitrosomonas supralitoralis TaxID=2116706 RepID=UPI001A8E744C